MKTLSNVAMSLVQSLNTNLELLQYPNPTSLKRLLLEDIDKAFNEVPWLLQLYNIGTFGKQHAIRTMFYSIRTMLYSIRTMIYFIRIIY